MSIFGQYAGNYFAAGISVIPLRLRSKAPLLQEWTAYGREMPSKGIQDMWIREYPDHNIGLPFGPASGLCAIDIDTDDQDMIDAILAELPKAVWIRRGKKGMGIVYKWAGQANFKLRNEDNESVVEFLGAGNQLVLPGSIHPDTGKAYVANCNLWEVVDDLPVLPLDIEHKLRAALGLKGVKLAKTTRSRPLEVVPPGERDIQLTRMAGYLARVVRGIDKTSVATLAEAMEQMEVWVREFTSRVAGDDMDPDKGVAKLLEYIMKDVEAGKTLPEGWDVGLGDDGGHWQAEIEAIRKSQEVQRWTVAKAKAWLKAEIDGVGAEDLGEALIAAMKRLREMLAEDDQFEDADREMLAAHVMAIGGKAAGLTKKTVMNSLRSDRARGGSGGDDEGGEDDHAAIALVLIEEMERDGEMRYAHEDFWQWNGSCFGKVEAREIRNTVSLRMKGNGLVRRAADYGAVTKVISDLLPQGLTEGTEDGINFANGFLDTSLELHEHSPKFGKTFTMPFNYVPERAGEAHKWLKFLEDCWGDDEDYEDKVKALQEVFAATMFGIGTRFQRAILLYGKAGTGKSVMLEVLQAMMPPAALCTVPPEDWAGRFQLSGLIGRTLNVCGELPESATLDGAMFKGVVCGEPMKGEYKGRDVFNFRPFATHWFASNHLPHSRDTSMGFVRRWQIFSFSRVVPTEERVDHFHEVLVSEEREAIAAWAMLGLSRLLKQRDYTQPASQRQYLQDIRRQNNSVYSWLEATQEVVTTGDADDTMTAPVLFDAYVWHMKQYARGWNCTFETFLSQLQELGYTVIEVNPRLGMKMRVVQGVRPPTAAEKLAAA